MTNESGIERELKFACDGLSGLREKLVASEAERVAPASLEDNLVFDRDSELEGSGRLLRLRRDGQGAVLTYKGVATFSEGVKEREERESRVGDPEALELILEKLGYRAVQRYQKYREEWRLGGVTVCLDHTPIGDFAEFEGDGAERLAERFGLDAAQAEGRNYLALYSDHRKAHPEAPEHMLFPEG